jgi:hypothetical protein
MLAVTNFLTVIGDLPIPVGHVIEMRYFDAPEKPETPAFRAALDAIFAELTTGEVEKVTAALRCVPTQMKQQMEVMLLKMTPKQGADIMRKFHPSGAALGAPPTAPLVVDVDTGVTYAQHSHFRDMREVVNGTVVDLPLEVRTDRPVRVVRGRVTRTQIVWMVLEVGASFPQTTLFFENENA